MKVRLTRRGDYAVRAMVTLARPGTGQLTGAALAEATGIPSSYVPQVMGDLVRAGLVANRRGRAGGYRLARDAERSACSSRRGRRGRRAAAHVRPARRSVPRPGGRRLRRARRLLPRRAGGLRHPVGRLPRRGGRRPRPPPTPSTAVTAPGPACRPAQGARRGGPRHQRRARPGPGAPAHRRPRARARGRAVRRHRHRRRPMGAIERFITSGISDEDAGAHRRSATGSRAARAHHPREPHATGSPTSRRIRRATDSRPTTRR